MKLPSRALAFALIAATALPAPLAAADVPRIDLNLLRHGEAALPAIWKPYRPAPLPPVDLTNGPLDARIVDGKLAVSLDQFLRLVVDNDLDLNAARYDYAIAQVDVLRAESGQAARGVASAPLPAGLFAGAIGAGVSSAAGLSGGGTGGAAISSQGRLIVIGPRGVFDPTFSMNLSYDNLLNPLNTRVVAGTPSVSVKSTVLQTRYQQQLPMGTSFSISFNLQRQMSTQANLLFNPALSSYGSFIVYQPLLNGFGRALTQRFVTLADNDRQIVREAFHTTLNTTLSQAANAYWDLAASTEKVRVAQQAVDAAKQQVNEDQERVQLGAMTPLDVVSAQSQFASARVQLVQAETARQQQQELVKTYISRTPDPALDAATIVPTDPLPVATDTPVPQAAQGIAQALTGRASVHQAELSLKNEHIAQEFTRKNLLPILSVYAMANVYGLAPGTSPAVANLIHWNYPEYSLGFTWSLPLFNRAAQADDLRARLETQQAEIGLQRTKQQITMQVRQSTLGLAQGRAQVEAARRAATASQAAYEGEQEKLRSGISTPYRVTLAQRDLMSAQSAEIQARVNYAKAVIAEQVAVGDLLQRHGIDVDQAQLGRLLAEKK